jgi:trimeric autotransporter adhesin
MAGLTGKQIAESYKDLLQLDNSNGGLTATTRNVKDGNGTASPLQLSNSAVNINGTFQLSGVTLTASASVLNAVADLTGATGMVAVSGGQVYGRTLTAGTGLSITNADGTEGNPTFSLNASGVVSGTYGPFSNFEVNQHGQVVSAATVNTSVSIPTLRADEIVGGTITLSSQASIGGDLNVDGAGTIDGIVSLADDLYVSGSTYIRTNLSVTGDTRTDFLYAVSASIEDARIGTLNFTDVSVSSFTASNLTVVSVVSVGTAILLAGDNVATSAGLATVSSALATSISTANTRVTSVSDFAVALSATMATSINNSNTNIAAVSALTSVNAVAITSINTVVDNLDFATSVELAAVSLALATSIATANTRITSVSDYAVALSATFATSINNSNTNIAVVSALTSVNAVAITSINTVIDNLDYATSAELAAVSSALATSIATANTRITSVSDFAVALSATMATSIANHLPLAGGTLTGNLLGTNITLSGDVSAVAYWGEW